MLTHDHDDNAVSISRSHPFAVDFHIFTPSPKHAKTIKAATKTFTSRQAFNVFRLPFSLIKLIRFNLFLFSIVLADFTLTALFGLSCFMKRLSVLHMW